MSIRRVLLFIVFVHVLLLSANSQSRYLNSRYNERTYIVSNYTFAGEKTSETRSIKSLLSERTRGFIFDLELSEDSTHIDLITPNNEREQLSETLDIFKSFFKRDTISVLTLFFNFNFNSEFLIKELKANSISQYFLTDEVTGEWPTFQTMLNEQKRIVCFSSQKKSSNNPYIKYLWDYAVEPCRLLGSDQVLVNEDCNGDSKNKLLYVDSYRVGNVSDPQPLKMEKIDHNLSPGLLGYSINLWRSTGKKPNFVVCDRFGNVFRAIQANLNTQLEIKGIASHNRRPLAKVFWEGGPYSVTYGEFSFPATPNEDLYLKPIKQGYKFTPEEVLFENIKENKIQNFVAVPVELSENLVAHLPFDSEISDKSLRNNELTNTGVRITNDKQRGAVAEFDGNSFITLPGADELGISNNDFTVSAWINLAKLPTREKRDFTILGTEQSHYRGGLHLQVRMNKPYFGFYSNDLGGVTTLDLNRWYHVVWRYTKYNQEQAIFINGLTDASSLNHAPFISDGNIFIGKSISQNNTFEGKIDDIIIWDRALGEEEVWNIYQDAYYLKENRFYHFYMMYKLPIRVLAVVVILFIVVFVFKSSSKRKVVKVSESPNINLNLNVPSKNAISLFGEFQVLDKEGVDITEKFTPRLRQIFIYLLIQSKEKKHGVSSDEFLNDIWSSFERKKAINNRGVNISKLRGLLESLDEVKIINIHDRWKVELSGNVICDYYVAYDKIGYNLFSQRDQLSGFLGVINRGAFLQDCMDPYFDDVKGGFSNKIIDILTRLLSEFDVSQNADIVNRIADRILMADDLNEEAIKYKIQALVAKQQLNQAKYLFKSFTEKFYSVYGQAYSGTFDEIIQ